MHKILYYLVLLSSPVMLHCTEQIAVTQNITSPVDDTEDTIEQKESVSKPKRKQRATFLKRLVIPQLNKLIILYASLFACIHHFVYSEWESKKQAQKRRYYKVACAVKPR